MVKGYIEKVENRYSYRVRIPTYHRLENTPGAVPTDELPIAPVCTTPGVSPSYKVGDVVWLDFENDEIGFPVITGLLYREESSDAVSDIKVDSLVVDTDANLPTSTNIGNVGEKSIQSLSNIIDSVGARVIPLTAGQDLNDLDTPGYYHSSDSTISSSLLNCPYTESGFDLIVGLGEGNTGSTQFLITSYATYTRMWTEEGWTEWLSYTNHPDFKNVDLLETCKNLDRGLYYFDHTCIGTPIDSDTAVLGRLILGTSILGETSDPAIIGRAQIGRAAISDESARERDGFFVYVNRNDAGALNSVHAIDTLTGEVYINVYNNEWIGWKSQLSDALLQNNGTTAEAGKYPLDAAYGKTLTDLGFLERSVLATDTDLNSIIQQGSYILSSNNTYTNMPYGQTNGLLLVHSSLNRSKAYYLTIMDGGVKKYLNFSLATDDGKSANAFLSISPQSFFIDKDEEIYRISTKINDIRYYFCEYSNNGFAGLKNDLISTNADFDIEFINSGDEDKLDKRIILLKVGNQYVTSQIDTDTSPWGGSVQILKNSTDRSIACVLTLEEHEVIDGASYTEQTFLLPNAHIQYIRGSIDSGNSWTAWVEPFMGRGVLPNNTDVNTVTIQGSYVLSASNIYTNLPPGQTYGVLVVDRGAFASSFINQTYMDPYHTTQYIRGTQNGGTTWSSWVKIGVQSEADNKVAIENGYAKNLTIYQTANDSGKAVMSYEAGSNITLENLIAKLRYTNGCMGSASVVGVAPMSTTATWYNFIYIPHRTGGNYGSAQSNNCNYGTLLLFHITSDTSEWYLVEYQNQSIKTPKKFSLNTATTSSAGLLRQLDGSTANYLRGDGTWATPPNTTYGLATTSANGLLRQLNGSTANYMRGDGTWQTPPNTWRGIQNVLTSTSTTDSLSANMGKTLDGKIGVVYKGNTNLTSMTLANIGTWIKNNFVANVWISARLNAASGATGGYFSTSSLGILAMCSSVNYGWAIVQSDHSNSIVFGILSAGTWSWKHPTLSNVS